jgi:uncharacterized protein (DUF1501 family)
MLTLLTDRRYRDCDGSTRRDFLKVGALGATGLALPHLLAARAQAAAAGQAVKSTSVVWLWLGGGPTHVETFDPKMTAPAEYRSVTGEEKTDIPGVSVGGTLPKIAKVAKHMALVRSFAHTNSGHGGGTHFVMTGYDNRMIDNGGLPTRPGIGAIASRVRGPNAPTGVPTYIRLGGIGADGPAFLGAAFAPFDPSGQAARDMQLKISQDRLADRRALLTGLDTINRSIDGSGLMDGLDDFEKQAFNVVLGTSRDAFDITKEDSKTQARYGPGLGQQLLRARRLAEAGAGFVTVSYGGWDMHGNIRNSMNQRSPQLDTAVSAFIEDTVARGSDKNILLVITGEFGRTPKVNNNAGRDHWAPLSTLALAGGGLKMGQAVGDSDERVSVPRTAPIRPLDLMATVFHVLGLPRDLQFVNNAGRPVYMLEGGTPIRELV